jgi:transcriptional regulator with XRE-family HTH domain
MPVLRMVAFREGGPSALGRVIHVLLDGRPQQWLATQTGATPSTVSRWNRAPRLPDSQYLYAVAHAFDLTVDQFAGLVAAETDKPGSASDCLGVIRKLPSSLHTSVTIDTQQTSPLAQLPAQLPRSGVESTASPATMAHSTSITPGDVVQAAMGGRAMFDRLTEPDKHRVFLDLALMTNEEAGAVHRMILDGEHQKRMQRRQTDGENQPPKSNGESKGD